jgi:hypothetical protein
MGDVRDLNLVIVQDHGREGFDSARRYPADPPGAPLDPFYCPGYCQYNSYVGQVLHSNLI